LEKPLSEHSIGRPHDIRTTPDVRTAEGKDISLPSDPEDFDGLTANAPVTYNLSYPVAGYWPSVVMGSIAAPLQCVFASYQKAIILACVDLDGATDGVVVLPDRYFYDMRDLIGFEIECFDMNTIVTVD